MTPKEMEIRILNDLSGLAAQRTRKFFKEQIELELNAVIDQFVLSAVKETQRGYFTVEAQYYDVVQSLIQTTSLAVHQVAGNQVTYLPLDTHRLLDAYAFGGYPGSLPISTTVVTRYSYTLSIPPGVAPQYFKELEFKVGSTSLYKRSGAQGYSTPDVYQAMNELVSAVPGLAWERAYNQAYSGKLIYVTEQNLSPVLIADGTTALATLVKTEASLKRTVDKNSSISTRRVKNQMRSEVLSTPYYKPTAMDLPVFLSQDILELHTPDSMIVNSLLVTYIRRPRKMSLSLNIGCDLDPGFHSTICDMTVQRIRERIGDPKYQTGNTL